MNQPILRKIVLPFVLGLFSFFQLHAQSPGIIVAPKNGNGVTILNPNGDKYSSKTSAGYTTNDITESEVPFKVVPPIIAEAAGDNANGATGGFTDIISTLDGSGFYSHFDGTNILFRLRMGGTNNGAKAYSVLLDTDMKFGGTGQYFDPNYIAPGIGTKNGNPGFEYEIVFSSQFDVKVYDIDGKTTGVVVATYPLQTHSQISVALSKDGGDADYFYDWGVPAFTIGTPAQIRFVATTQISPHPAISGHISDMYGTPDDDGSSIDERWGDIIESQCGFSTSMLSGSSPLCQTCTNAPTINPITVTGNNVAITGNWVSLHPSKPNTATISLYRNGTLVGSTTATSGMGWSITLPTVYSNDIFTAKAKATDESECLASPPVLSGCTIRPTAPVITCAGRKGIEGTLPTGAEVIIYQVTSTGRTLMNAGLVYTNNATDRKFDFHGTTGQTGAACQGNANDIADGTYEFITSLNGCYSQPIFICVTGAISYTTVAANTITLNTPILSKHTSVTGTGATIGEVLLLYRNGYLQASQTAAATTFTFSGLTLFQFDELKVYSQSTASSSCITASNTFTVTCVTESPTINANAQGEVLSSATSISGTAADPGTTIRLYKGSVSSSTLVSTTTVASNGVWSIGGLTLIPGDTYFATCTNQCESAASRIVVVKAPTTVCPTITGSYTETSTLVTGTMPASFTGKIRLYLDNALIDSVSLNNATSWSIVVNNSLDKKMYAYGVLRATAEGVNLAEGPVCSSVQIQCVPPALPDVTPTSVSIKVGQTASFAISNPVDTLLYSIWDAYGNNYASSKFGAGTSMLTLPSYIFNTVGTYDLMIVADKLTGSGCYNSRSVTVVVQHSTLATKFISLAAVKAGQQVRLNWKVANEEAIKHYRVERSRDGISFEPVCTVPYQAASGPVNSYAAVDNNLVPAAKLYYRIVAVTTGEGYQYSHVATVGGAEETKIQIVPNPVRGVAKLYIESKEEQLATAELTDLQGKTLLVKKLYLYEGANMVGFDGLEKLPGGNYILGVTTKTGQQYLRLVIQ